MTDARINNLSRPGRRPAYSDQIELQVFAEDGGFKCYFYRQYIDLLEGKLPVHISSNLRYLSVSNVVPKQKLALTM